MDLRSRDGWIEVISGNMSILELIIKNECYLCKDELLCGVPHQAQVVDLRPKNVMQKIIGTN